MFFEIRNEIFFDSGNIYKTELRGEKQNRSKRRERHSLYCMWSAIMFFTSVCSFQNSKSTRRKFCKGHLQLTRNRKKKDFRENETFLLFV